MQSIYSMGRLYGQLGSVLWVFVTGSALIFAGCSGDDAAQAPSLSTTQSTLNSEILPVPLSTTEADRFLAVTATTGDRYYAAGFTTVNDDSQAIARFGLTG